MLTLTSLELLEDRSELELESETDVSSDDQDVEKLGFVKEFHEGELRTLIRPADVVTTPRDDIPSSGQNTSFVRLEYRISTPVRRAYDTSGFQSLNRKFESEMIAPFFAASRAGALKVLDLTIDGDVGVSAPRKGRLSNTGWTGNDLFSTADITSFL